MNLQFKRSRLSIALIVGCFFSLVYASSHRDDLLAQIEQLEQAILADQNNIAQDEAIIVAAQARISAAEQRIAVATAEKNALIDELNNLPPDPPPEPDPPPDDPSQNSLIVNQVIDSIDFATIGDPGNKPTMRFSSTPTGGTRSSYRIGRFEITNAQILPFLNSVDPSGVQEKLILGTVGPDVPMILNTTGPEGQRYSMPAIQLDHPARVSWYVAARFANWLHNGTGEAGSDNGDNINGAYDTRAFNDEDHTNDPATRNPGAKFWLPSESEWVKAAYFKGGATTADYWVYPSATDQSPTCRSTPTLENNVGLCTDPSNSVTPPGSVAVGSFINTMSPSGLFDLIGNAGEWTETLYEGDFYSPFSSIPKRMMRGGHWRWQQDHSAINYRYTNHQKQINHLGKHGFRLAAIDPTASDVSPELTVLRQIIVRNGDVVNIKVTATDPNSDLISMEAFAYFGLPLTRLFNGASFVDHGDGTADFTWTAINPGAGDVTQFLNVYASDGTYYHSDYVRIIVRP